MEPRVHDDLIDRVHLKRRVTEFRPRSQEPDAMLRIDLLIEFIAESTGANALRSNVGPLAAIRSGPHDDGC
jgi:hypothetical protein